MAQAEGRGRLWKSKPQPLAAALPFAVFALLALVSWNRWLEPYVDSGRELMVPWRVSQGERLYRDVEFHHGPLAPFLGAASDRVFGRSLPARTALAAVAFVRLRPPPGLSESLGLFPPLVRVVPPIVVAAAVWRLVLRLGRRDPQGALARVPDAVLWIAALFAVRLLLAAGYVGPYDAFFLPLPLIVCLVGLYGLAERASASVGACARACRSSTKTAT